MSTRSQRGTASAGRSTWKHGSFTSTKAPRASAPVVGGVAVDALLSDWRRAGEGRIVQVGPKGVTLYPGVGVEPVQFKDAAAAIEFLTRRA